MNKNFLAPVALLLALASCGPSTNSTLLKTDSEKNGIINGESVRERRSKAAKAVVYVDLLDRHNQSIGFCTGALIAKNAVLTAGHCFDSDVTAGVSGFRIIFDDQSNYHIRQGRVSISHPSYNSTRNYDHDIAVAFFQGEVPSGYNTVSYDQEANPNYANQNIYVYGYGRTRDFGERSDFFTANSGFLHRGVLRIDSSFKRHPDRYMTDPDVKTYTCYGDSGGPQFYHEGGVLKVVGISSAVYGKKDSNGVTYCRGSRAQATKVAYFASWIRTQLQKY